VSLWTRDIAVEPGRRRRAHHRAPNALQRRKAEEIDRLLAEGRSRIGRLTDRDLLIAGTALYAGEGFKSRYVGMANTDPRSLLLFLTWLRRFFDIEEARLRVTLYLHDGLDIEAATTFWSEVTSIPPSQFGKPYRPRPAAQVRLTKHQMGCPRVSYYCSRTLRGALGLVEALLGCLDPFRGSSIGRASDC
jgi:hypothetical protein